MPGGPVEAVGHLGEHVNGEAHQVDSLVEPKQDSKMEEFPYLPNLVLLSLSVAPSARRKTSFELDFDKVASAKDILGTHTLTETVDAALGEVVRMDQRRRLVELLFTPGRLQLDDPDVMAGAWR